MATPDEPTVPAEDAPTIVRAEQQQPTESTIATTIANGDASMIEETHASLESRPAPSPNDSPMNNNALNNTSTTDTHMNGTDEDVSDNPQESTATASLQVQPDATMSSIPPEAGATPPAPQSQPPAPLQQLKDAPSPSPRSTPAPSGTATSTPTGTRVHAAAAAAAAAQDAIPSQMANNEHGSAARVYINSHITPTLLEGMKWVAKHEPEKPLKWLSEFLARRSAELEGT